jgi:hypothetical protein
MAGAFGICAIALTAFTWPHLEEWPGLAASCPLADVERVLAVPDKPARGSGFLGEDRRTLAWLSASGGGFPDSIRVWLDGDQVVLLEAPVLEKPKGFDALIGKLGSPAAKLDAIFSNVKMAKSEWVYPDRGLTLFVNPDNQVVLRVAAYRRTTLDDYRKRLRPITLRSTRPTRPTGPTRR